MKIVSCIVLLLAFFGSMAQATPARQKSVEGVVRRLDRDHGHLVLSATPSNELIEFSIVAKRTRLRRDGRPAQVSELEEGRAVQVYYRREGGGFVATQIMWQTPPRH